MSAPESPTLATPVANISGPTVLVRETTEFVEGILTVHESSKLFPDELWPLDTTVICCSANFVPAGKSVDGMKLNWVPALNCVRSIVTYE